MRRNIQQLSLETNDFKSLLIGLKGVFEDPSVSLAVFEAQTRFLSDIETMLIALSKMIRDLFVSRWRATWRTKLGIVGAGQEFGRSEFSFDLRLDLQHSTSSPMIFLHHIRAATPMRKRYIYSLLKANSNDESYFTRRYPHHQVSLKPGEDGMNITFSWFCYTSSHSHTSGIFGAGLTKTYLQNHREMRNVYRSVRDFDMATGSGGPRRNTSDIDPLP